VTQPDRNNAHGQGALVCDVAVYAATAGGVIAAIAAATEGMRVALIEPGRHVGGMVSGGLGWTDSGNPQVIGGLALEFYERVARAYGVETWKFVGPEPHVAERIFREWLAELGVTLLFDARVERVLTSERRITGLITGGGQRIVAQVVIDASYEGDVLARAGVPYAVGRESAGLYGERWAGRLPIVPNQHQIDAPVRAFRDEQSRELLPLIHSRPLAREGEGDGGVQSYCFRLCLTRDPVNQLPFPRPEGYDPDQFELLRRYLAVAGARVRARTLIGLVPHLPNQKCDVNSIGPISTNLLDGSSWEYPDADYPRRQEIWDRHLRYTQGLLYFLANDQSVPEHIREELSGWGLCKDEFADTGHWPHQLYVRDARRMRGEYLMTQADLEGSRLKYDSVGLGSYNIDIREVQRVYQWVSRYPNLVAETFNEGYLSAPVRPYAIPFRSLTPRYEDCENLLVPVCVSASHVAFASIRMEPQYMILGHAAGVAAALAVKEQLAVQRVPVAPLQRALRAQRQVLEP
jgi:hypothetical protein